MDTTRRARALHDAATRLRMQANELDVLAYSLEGNDEMAKVCEAAAVAERDWLRKWATDAEPTIEIEIVRAIQ